MPLLIQEEIEGGELWFSMSSNISKIEYTKPKVILNDSIKQHIDSQFQVGN